MEIPTHPEAAARSKKADPAPIVAPAADAPPEIALAADTQLGALDPAFQSDAFRADMGLTIRRID